MLSKLLSREECAKCRLCCCFDSYDLWETPIITRDTASRILQEYAPSQKFIHKEGEFLLRLEREPDKDLYYCTMLDHEKGCIMGDNKPFDCRIWPFRIMSFKGTRVIVLSPVCPVVQTKPLDKIAETAKELAPQIFAYADETPLAVKPYMEGYPILVVESEEGV